MSSKLETLEIYRNAVSKTLEKITQTDNIQEVFHDVLTDVLHYYHAGRVAIMQTMAEHPDLQQCIFEVNALGIDDVMDCLGGTFKKTSWRYDRLEFGKSIIINDTEELPAEAEEQKLLLRRLGIKSHIAVPIPNSAPQTGFLCIDIMTRPTLWTADDERLLKDIANLIMTWSKLQTSNRKIRDEKDYLRDVLGKIPVGLALYAPDGRLTYANERTLNIFGLGSIDDVSDFNLFRSMILTSEDLENIRKRDLYDAAFEYGYGYRPTQSTLDSKRMLYVMARYRKLYDNKGNIKAYLAAYVDRTSETNIANRVKELDGFISVCADFARLGFARVNAVDGVGYGTRQWFRNFNMPNDDSAHTYPETINRLHPDDLMDLMHFRRRAKEDPTATYNGRVRVKKNNHSDKWDYLQIYSVVTHYEPQNGIVETSTISQRINSQVDLEKSLIKAKNDAEKADHLKSAFLANMSHEIRTPLNAIVGFSQLLCSGDIPPEERDEVMTIIDNNNYLLLQLISDILDLAKLEAGTLEFKMKDTEATSVCKSVASSVEMRVKPGVKLWVACPETQFHFTTDPNRLRQVLINFATNAAKFTDSGYIRLGYLLTTTGRIRFFCEDTGIGISKEEKEKVFERFVKLNAFQQGTGLGLQISKEIVLKLGGQIGVESELGHGSNFWCELPVEK